MFGSWLSWTPCARSYSHCPLLRGQDGLQPDHDKGIAGPTGDGQCVAPDEWTFSRAFSEFSKSRLPERVHEALIQKCYAGELVGHISRDSSAIVAREKPLKMTAVEKVAVKRGRPKQGEERVKPQTRIEKQAAGLPRAEMIGNLPTACDVGTKQNSKGHKTSWIGYKLHLDVADGGIPISGLLTSNPHD